MSFLQRLFGPVKSKPDAPATAQSNGNQMLTPEALGGWLAGQQREFFASLLAASQAENSELPPLELSAEALTDVSCNAYAIQVAMVAFTYHEFLDDSRFLGGGSKGGADILQFLTRIQSKAREASTPYAKINTPQCDPFSIAGCIIDIKDLLPKILLYYGSLFMGLEPLARAKPEAVRFAEGLVEQMKMKTTNPLAGAMALAYFFAYKEVLTKGGRIPSPDPCKPDVHVASIMLRTWGAWTQFLFTFQERLFAFAGDRKPAFQ